MKTWSVNEIRSLWLDLFRQNGYLFLKPSSLIPEEDESLLFINSGVATLKKYFNNPETSPAKNLVNCQNVVRTNDIDRIDEYSYHQTLFEMLGCFSIGGDFKEQVIPIIWSFFTEEKMLNIDSRKLFITVLEGDESTYNVWKNQKGIVLDNIVIASRDTNFWDMGDGPCGPNTEIYYSFNEINNPKEIKVIDLDSKNFIEIINIVFSEFYHKNSQYLPLSKKCVDVGAGLERIALILQGVDSTFKTDIWEEAIMYIISFFKKNDISLSSKDKWKIYVIADHLRTAIFAISDGVFPYHKRRGYVLKKLIKKVVLLSYTLEFDIKEITNVCKIITIVNSKFYEKLEKKSEHVISIIEKEVIKISESIKRSIKKVSKELKENFNSNNSEVSSEKVFFWYDTYGVPIEIIRYYLSSFARNFDEEGFNNLLKIQRSNSSSEREDKKISTF